MDLEALGERLRSRYRLPFLDPKLENEGWKENMKGETELSLPEDIPSGPKKGGGDLGVGS